MERRNLLTPRKPFCLLLGILSLMMIAGCAGSKPYLGDITEFSYHYGSYFGGYYEYDLVLQDDAVHFTARGLNGVELDIDKEVDPSVLDDLSSAISDNHLETWDGFSESNDNVLDGYSFGLNVAYDDDRELSAGGYEMYPDNYEKVHDELVEILESID